MKKKKLYIPVAGQGSGGGSGGVVSIMRLFAITDLNSLCCFRWKL